MSDKSVDVVEDEDQLASKVEADMQDMTHIRSEQAKGLLEVKKAVQDAAAREDADVGDDLGSAYGEDALVVVDQGAEADLDGLQVYLIRPDI